MAQSRIKVAMILVAITLLSAGESSQQDECNDAIVSLMPCIDYITGEGSAPTADCCQKFAAVVSSKPLCLCIILNGGGSQFGVQVNQTRALALPAACKVQTPPTSLCNAAQPSPAVSPPGGGGGNSGGGDSAGSFLKPMALPAVLYVVIAYLLMSSMSF